VTSAATTHANGTRTGLIAATAIVLLFDIPWLTFRAHSHWGRIGWIPFLSPPVRIADCLQNVLLFLPLGWFAVNDRRGIAAAGAIGLALSLSCELAQVYSHNRFPSVTDVVCNLMGTVIGAAAWRVSTRGARGARYAGERDSSP
jgi:glycopeptide antibiotics resistance protein